MCAPNNRMSKYMRQKLIELQGKTDKSIIRVGDFNTSLSEIGRSIRQEISKDIIELHNTINQLDIIDYFVQMYILKLTWAFIKTDHILGYKTHTNKFKSLEII